MGFRRQHFCTEINPVHTYKISGDYYVTLKIFNDKLSKSVTKKITIKIIESNLDKNQFIYEFTDTGLKNAIAIKGYEDEDNFIVYQINQDSNYYHGAYQLFKNNWRKSISSGKDFLIKRQNGSYAYIHDTIIVNLDKFGNESNQINIVNTKIIECVRNYDNNVIVTRQLSYKENYPVKFQMLSYNSNNIVSSVYPLHFYYGNDLTNYSNNLYQIIAYSYSDQIDFAISCSYSGISPYDPYRRKNNYDMFKVNGYDKTPFLIINDFIRIDTNTIVVVANNTLLMINGKSCKYDSLINPISPNTIILNKIFNHTNLKSLLKINDSCFCAVGSNYGSPAIFVFDKNGNLLDSVIITNRYGSFEFVSSTPDDNLLLSGYRYKYFGDKSPYFIKYKIPDYSIQKGDTSIKNTFKLYIYPNPVTDNLNLQFHLKKPGFVSLKIFDMYGNCIYSVGNNKNSGLCELKIDISSLSLGIYFYKLEYEGNSFTGKFIF
ncbi:MAG: T9SS type A sorting domain-containing protein [Bacteroidetes bacterium]|nr:MAG: T9SS type A sorting domain-containing protein [Bacteroidota bacterium]